MSDIPTSSEPREVLYNSCYGGFGLSSKILTHLYQQHPNIFPIVVDNYTCEEDDFLKGIYEPYCLRVRDSQGIIRNLDPEKLIRHDRRLIEAVKFIGLFDSSGYHCTLAIKDVFSGYDYRIDEYDGCENVTIFPDYKEIVNDLVQYYKTGSHEFQCPITQQVIDGELTL